MTQVWFCSDLHFGHQGIEKFRNGVISEEDNRAKICGDWIKQVRKKDSVYVLGDAVFTMETLSSIQSLPGTKYLVRGNHDLLNTSAYLKVFKEVYGLLKYKEFWLSHAPIHPDELRNRYNLHGHVHYMSLDDSRYLNCCPENLWELTGSSLVSLDWIRKYFNENSNRRY